MNIWDWVDDLKNELYENGQERFAELLDRLPSAVLEDENAEVEAIVPEALALARSLEHPWAEIFIRHWHLQAVGDGFAKVPDAIETLEFSHREEHIACPQSVCTVQDLALAYAGADGPGYAEERLRVCDETLARIDVNWPCFACITTQKVNALSDADRDEEAVALADEMRAQLRASGQSTDEAENAGTGSLIALGRCEEALERARARPDERDDAFARWRALTRANALAELGRAAEAREELLPLDVVLGEPEYHMHWADVVGTLSAAGEWENDWRLGATLERMVAMQLERGRAWEGFQLAEIHAKLALQRQAPGTAGRALVRMREFAAQLRDPGRVASNLQEIEAQIDAAPEPDVELPDTPDAFGEQLQADEEPDPEAGLERLRAAARRWPDDLRVAWWHHVALLALERDDEGLAVLEAFADAHRDDDEAQMTYGHALIDAGRFEGVEAVAARISSTPHADWMRARGAYASGDSAAAREHAQRIVAGEERAPNSHRLLAMIAEEEEDFATALEHRNALLAIEETKSDHWDRMVPATALGDWEAVRASAAFLEIELPGDEGPIDVDMEFIRLRFDARDFALARRTGPVSARVLSISDPGRPQHAGDRVVFDAAPIGEVEEGKLVTFGVVTVLEEGLRRVYPFDGVRPDDEAWQALADALIDDGWLIDVRSAEQYELEVDGEKRPAIYGWVALPDDVSDEAAHTRLRELTADWEQPFTWLPLAEAAGDEDAVEAWRPLVEELALY